MLGDYAMSSATLSPSDPTLCPTLEVTRPIVFVVDDDISVREALEHLILCTGARVETFASAEAFLLRERPLTPSCLLLDMNLPDLHGLDLQERIAASGTGVPIIFITAYGDVPTTVRAMKAGAVEFLTKPLREDALLSAIEEALRCSAIALANEARVRVLSERYASLSRREREVMGLVVGGMLNKLIAGRLGISEITVKAHRAKMMRKMHAASLADLVKMAAKLRYFSI